VRSAQERLAFAALYIRLSQTITDSEIVARLKVFAAEAEQEAVDEPGIDPRHADGTAAPGGGDGPRRRWIWLGLWGLAALASIAVLVVAIVGRDRGGVAEALKRVTARSVVAGVDSDRLYPLYQAKSLAEGLGGEPAVITSPYGHDSFLIETDQISALVKSLLG